MAIYSKTVVGLDKLIKDFKKLPEEAIVHLEKASIDSGAKILTDAKAAVPIETGELRNALKLRKPGAKRKKKAVIISQVTFPKSVAYAVPLELGHKLVMFGKTTNIKVKERPFLRPAADANKQYAIDRTIDGINKALTQFGNKK